MPMNKNKLIAELARHCDLPQTKVRKLLDQLTQIGYREVHNGFTIPGLCRLKIAKRKASKCRNPATGQLLQVAEHDVVKAVVLKKMRDRITPKPAALTQPLPDPPTKPQPQEKAPAPSSPSASETPPAPPPSPEPASEEGQIICECPHCNNALAAAPSDAGKSAICPFCNSEFTIPDASTTSVDSIPDTSDSTGAFTFFTFTCESCGQEIQGPTSMAGTTASCPTCGSQLQVPEYSPDNAPPESQEAIETDDVDKSSMTIRMNLSDFTDIA